MSAPRHDHDMQPISWTTYTGREDDFPPCVVMSCMVGGCIKIEVVRPGKRDRKVPAGVTKEQFQALKSGTYWLDIPTGATPA